MFENNQVSLVGEIVSDFTYSHEVFENKFYKVILAVSRFSEYVDYIPVIVSERLIDVGEDYFGDYASIKGQFRSFNKHEEDGSHLILSVFAMEFNVLEGKEENVNEIFLDGRICKEPVYRKTFFGRRITDVLIASNRSYGKSDYIPCICWGRTARFTSTLGVGTRVKVKGRIQSRDYEKRISETEIEKRVAYEVSVSIIEL